MWDAFAARFPYEETDDQLVAVKEVISDLGSGKPMDRLICGDVGFGKTEIAMQENLLLCRFPGCIDRTDYTACPATQKEF